MITVFQKTTVGMVEKFFFRVKRKNIIGNQWIFDRVFLSFQFF